MEDSIYKRYLALMAKADEFLGEVDTVRTTSIDYEQYITNLNRYAEGVLNLDTDLYRVDFKGVFLHGRTIHTLIYRVDFKGRRYTAGITRRVSLGIRDHGGDRWQNQLKTAHDIAMTESPVALDPRLEDLPDWSSSNTNKSRMIFKRGTSSITINAHKVISAKGDRADLRGILSALKIQGL